ncbi:unnamed protein product [Prorocentrum cordatum]|uniref:Exostosin GT47 domain-containing protein n=1 Tax=Prorocentrum cordatum TaxID=2364126 RepID=A0ABN9UXW3_9DINO|nr:unnamed protein product [Polarella glacialis]
MARVAFWCAWLTLGESNFWEYVANYDELFRADALEYLREPGRYPPSIAVRRLRTSQSEGCVTEGRLHQFEVDAEMGLTKFARKIVNSSAADFTLVPHCLGNRITRFFEYCRLLPSQKQLSLHKTGCWAFVKDSLEPSLRAWVGEISRRIGPGAVVVLSLTSSRLFAKALQGIPFVIGYAGATNWLARHFPSLSAGVPPDFGCGTERTRRATGQSSWMYPHVWPQDVVVQSPSPFDYRTDWRSSAERPFLFSFVGQNTSCVRNLILRAWGKSVRPDVYVADTSGSDLSYSTVLQRSQYCLVPDGHVPWTFRFLDVLHHGCVPVVVSESWHPPLHRILHWTDAQFPVLFVHPARVRGLHERLAMEEPATWSAMQRQTAALAAALDMRSDVFYELQLAELVLAVRDRP